MNLKKTNNLHTASSKSTNFNHFRTIVKSRVSKQTLKDVAHLSATLQQTIDNDDKRSVKSSISVHKKSTFESNPTDKIKNFVRNMKMTKKFKEQPTPVRIPKTNENRDLGNSRASIYSTRSNKSKVQNFVSMHLQKDILDNKSVISTKSIYEADGMSKSKIIFSKQNEDLNKEKMLDKLNRLEQKMDFLVKNKLRNLMLRARSKHRYSPKPFLGARGYTTQIDQNSNGLLEKQIQTIVQAIAALKQKDSDQTLPLPQLEENISELDKKIQLLEKILASNFTEAQILRKFYFAQKSQKCPHLSRKQKIIQELSKRKQMLKSNFSMVQMRDLKNKTPIIKYESTSKYFHTKPSRAAYENLRNNSKPFVANRQPFPRSSYDREFLNYGTLPVFNYKPHDSKHSSSKLNVKTSSYQQAFKQKHMQLTQINYKELDCFKDKIKTGSISFSEMYKNKSMINKSTLENMNKSKQKDVGKDEKENKSSIQKALDTLNNLQKLSKYDGKPKFMGGTEMKRQFVWHSGSKVIDNQLSVSKYGRNQVIKDAKLDNFKATYKMEFLR